jgi:hypothetical protein
MKINTIKLYSLYSQNVIYVNVDKIIYFHLSGGGTQLALDNLLIEVKESPQQILELIAKLGVG